MDLWDAMRYHTGRVTRFDRSEEMLFDIVAIKLKTGEFKISRVGAGGPACDRYRIHRNKFD